MQVCTVKHTKSDSKSANHTAIRQSPYYHNCKLLSPDGSLLAIVDRKKLDWYSERNLGGKDNDDGKSGIKTLIDHLYHGLLILCRNC